MRTLNELETLVKNLDGGSLSSIKVLRDRFDIENENVLTVEKVPKRAHDRGRIAITVRNDYPDWIVGDPIGVLALSHYITKKVAKSLKEVKRILGEEKPALQKARSREFHECPRCGAEMAFEEGCMKCHSCGYSECG